MSARFLVQAGVALALGGGLAAMWLNQKGQSPTPAASQAASVGPAEDASARELFQRELFQRAFWRRPAAGDRILQTASLPVDQNASGSVSPVTRWFLAVEPGPALSRALGEQNPFSLKPAAPAPVADAPAWFPRDLSGFSMRIGSGPTTRVVLTSADGRRVYVAGTARGFSPAAPDRPGPPPSLASQQTPRRLPATPPPNPKAP